MRNNNLMNDHIMICSSFKCASTTLEKTFNCDKIHDILPNNMNNIDTILIPFNDDLDKICKSAYFQDIIVPSYEYSPFHKKYGILKTTTCSISCGDNCIKDCCQKKIRMNIIKNIEIKELINHYNTTMKNQKWCDRIHLNNEIRHMILCEILKLNLSFTSKEIQTFYTKYKNKNIKIIYFHISNINNNFENLKYSVFGQKMNHIKLKKFNVSSDKWYNKKYIEFIKNYKDNI